MAFETAFLELMSTSVTVTPFSAYTTGGYGARSYGTASTYQARVVQKRVIRPQGDGNTFTYTHTAWLNTTASIDPRAKVTYAGSTYRIVEVGRFPDEDGLHHVRLLLDGA